MGDCCKDSGHLVGKADICFEMQHCGIVHKGAVERVEVADELG